MHKRIKAEVELVKAAMALHQAFKRHETFPEWLPFYYRFKFACEAYEETENEQQSGLDQRVVSPSPS